jgi:hypothetical protein
LDIVLKKRVIISWLVLAVVAAAVGYLVWAVVSGTCARQYATAQILVQDAVDGYREANSNAMPILSDVTVMLEKPEGTFFIVDMCALVSGGHELEQVPDGSAQVSGSSNDNCDAGDCSCNNEHHYLWLVDSYGKVLSMCIGTGCNSNNEDGYQDIWP